MNIYLKYILLSLVVVIYACEGSTPPLPASDQGTINDRDPSTDYIDFCSSCTTDDCDHDGVTNDDEKKYGTDPCSSDTDGDGINDRTEIEAPKLCISTPESSTPRPLQVCNDDSDCPTGNCVGLDPTNPDQDNDGVKDGEEDRNHDGLIGDCVFLCPTGNECHASQTCSSGFCTPALDPQCLESETDPRLSDTDGDGIADKDEGQNLVCNTDALINPTLNTNITGDWTLALDPAFSAVRNATYTNPSGVDAAATFDSPTDLVAGFILSKQGQSNAIQQDESDETIMNNISGLTISAVFNRRSFQTYDGFSAVVSQRIITASTIGTDKLRDQLLSAISEQPSGAFSVQTTSDYGSATQFSLLITTVVRSDRILIVGAIAPSSAFDNTSNQSAIRMRDLTNATGIATAHKGLDAECDDFNVESLPVADIVWLVDASGSMNDDQALISDTATEFFTKLQASSLDFRVGVMQAGSSTSNVNLTGGQFTTDQNVFSAQITNPTGPSGDETETPITAGKNLHQLTLSNAPAVTQPGDMSQGLRPNAKLIYIFTTDEDERTLQSSDTSSRTATQTQVESQPGFQPLLDYYIQNGIIAFGMIALAPECTNAYEPSWAAKSVVEQTGGAYWPICKTDKTVLTAALNALITAAQGAASTFSFARVPISSTIKLALNTTIVPRSSKDGFDYDGPNNSIFFNTPSGSQYTPQLGDEVFISYRFFEDSTVIP